jgi:hypothetical protein
MSRTGHAYGTRNDLVVFRSDMTALRATASAEKSGNAVRDAVSAFDNLVGQYTKQFLDLVPLSKRRGDRLQRGRFHDLDATTDVLLWFDINLLTGLATGEAAFLKRMFLRWHIYEHKGGEVDQAYQSSAIWRARGRLVSLVLFRRFLPLRKAEQCQLSLSPRR